MRPECRAAQQANGRGAVLPLPVEGDPEANGDADRSAPAVPLGEKWTLTIEELHALTGISVRHLRRLDCEGALPGRLTVGRKVLFRAEAIREWIAAGCPDRAGWEALQRAGRPARQA